MHSGVALHHSRLLAGLSPSTSPPLGERNRQSWWTTSHFDSHTLGDHEDEIPEMSSPLHKVGEEDPISTYDASHEQPSPSSYDPSFASHQY